MSLTEIALILLMLGFLAVTVVVASRAVHRNFGVSSTSQAILSIAQAIRLSFDKDRYLDRTIRGSAGALIFARAGFFPEGMLDDPEKPSKIFHVWGGGVTLDALFVEKMGDAFMIGFEAVPREACVDLLVRVTNDAKDSGLIAAGTEVSAQDNTVMPFSESLAAGDCSLPKNKVVFSFVLRT